MAASVNYPSPVWVNGYQCRNCSDVDLAKKHIDPAHPKSGPYGVDAKSDPSRVFQESIRFGGVLAGTQAGGSGAGPSAPSATGGLVNFSV